MNLGIGADPRQSPWNVFNSKLWSLGTIGIPSGLQWERLEPTGTKEKPFFKKILAISVFWWHFSFEVMWLMSHPNILYKYNIPRFIALRFAAIHRYCTFFYKLKAGPSMGEKDYDLLYCDADFIAMAATRPAISLRYAYTTFSLN